MNKKGVLLLCVRKWKLLRKKTPRFVVQHISNIPKPIQMKFVTVVALKL